MGVPILYKDIEINERKFRLNKMNARDCSYMLFKMLKILTPILKSLKAENLEEMQLEDLNITEIAESLFSLEEKEFRYIQDHLLQTAQESLKGGLQQVLGSNLEFGVLDIENDVELVLNLTVQSLVFNLSGFFQGSWLKKLTNK